MGWNGEELRARNEKRKAQLEAKAREQQAHQELQPPILEPAGLTLTEEERQRIYEEEKAKREQPQRAITDPPDVAPQSKLRRIGFFLGIPLAVLVLLGAVMDQIADRRDAQRAQQAQLATQAAIVAEQRKVREAERRAEQQKMREVREAERKVEEARCRTDLQCWGEKKSLAAIFKCQDGIEKLAKHQAEWTDGWLEPKFSHFRWRGESRRVVTYIGDKIKFQNGFGAWTSHTYECDYDTEQDTALAVRAQPGRLS